MHFYKYVGSFFLLGLVGCSQSYQLENASVQIGIDLENGAHIHSIRYQGKNIFDELSSPGLEPRVAGDHSLSFSQPFDHPDFKPLLSSQHIEDESCEKRSALELVCTYRIENEVDLLGDWANVKFEKTFKLSAKHPHFTVTTQLTNLDSKEKLLDYSSVNSVSPDQKSMAYQENGEILVRDGDYSWEFSSLDFDQKLIFLSLSKNHHLAYFADNNFFRQYMRGPDFLQSNYHPVSLAPQESFKIEEKFAIFQDALEGVSDLSSLPSSYSFRNGQFFSLRILGSRKKSALGESFFSSQDEPRFLIQSYGGGRLELRFELREYESDLLLLAKDLTYTNSTNVFGLEKKLKPACYQASVFEKEGEFLGKDFFCVGVEGSSFAEVWNRQSFQPVQLALLFQSHMPWGYDDHFLSLMPVYTSFLNWFQSHNLKINLQITARAMDVMKSLQQELYNKFIALGNSSRVETLVSSMDWEIFPLVSKHLSRDFAVRGVTKDLAYKRGMDWSPQGLMLPEMAWTPSSTSNSFLEKVGLKYLVLDDSALPSKLFASENRFRNPVRAEGGELVFLRNAQLSHALWKQAPSRAGIWLQEARKRYSPNFILVATDLEQLSLSHSYERLLSQLVPIKGVRFVHLSSHTGPATEERVRLKKSSWQGGWRYWNGSSFDRATWKKAKTYWSAIQDLSSEKQLVVDDLLHRYLDGGHFWFEKNEAFNRLDRRITFELKQD